MGVTKKKPAVVAKTARKVKLTKSEVDFAKVYKIPLAEVAKAKLPKRGRPVGSKNKPKLVDGKAREEAIKKLVELGGSQPVDWEKLSKQLQEALAAEMKENESLEKVIKDFKAAARLDSSFTFWDRLVFLFSGKL